MRAWRLNGAAQWQFQLRTVMVVQTEIQIQIAYWHECLAKQCCQGLRLLDIVCNNSSTYPSIHPSMHSSNISGSWQVKIGKQVSLSKCGQTPVSPARRLLFLTNSNYFPLMSSRSGRCALPSSLLRGQQLQCWAWLAAYTDLFSLTDCRLHFLTAGSQPPGAQHTITQKEIHKHTNAWTCVGTQSFYLKFCFCFLGFFLNSISQLPWYQEKRTTCQRALYFLFNHAISHFSFLELQKICLTFKQ